MEVALEAGADDVSSAKKTVPSRWLPPVRSPSRGVVQAMEDGRNSNRRTSEITMRASTEVDLDAENRRQKVLQVPGHPRRP